MKKTHSLLVAVTLLTMCFTLVSSAEVCPYDNDYRYVLEKALADYYSNPQSSQMQPAEIKQMLDFYLSNPILTDADCSAGGIDALISKADDQIPDDILGKLDKRILPECDSCSDGTKCAEQNDLGQTCTCKDVNRDNAMEFCLLRPMKPRWPTCEVCSDGTACGESNEDGGLCACKDVNRDDKYEYCFLKLSRPKPNPPFSWPSCNQCSDGTGCGQNNSNGDECRCYDKRRNGNYSHCYISCDSCSDGTKCGEKNANGDLCGCRFGSRRWDDKYRECLLRCDKCSDGTDCWDRNSQGSLCTCGPRYSRRYYDKCSIWPPSNTTTTTGGTTTTSGPTTTSQGTTTTGQSTSTSTTQETTTSSGTTSTAESTTTTTSGTTTTAQGTTTSTSSATTTTVASGCDPKTLADSVSASNMLSNLNAFAKPRQFGTQGDTDAAAWVLNQMNSIGLDNVHYEDSTASIGKVRNVVGDLGSGSTIIVVGAHHDAVSGCNGADDNGGGTIAMLETAQVLSACRNNLTQYKIRFVSFDAEEPSGGYWGSEAYVNAHSGDSNPAMVNLDCLGNKDDSGLTVYQSSSGGSLSASADRACTYLKTKGASICSRTTGGGGVESDCSTFYDAGKEYLYPIEYSECGPCYHCKSCSDDTSIINRDKLAWGARYAVYVIADNYLK